MFAADLHLKPIPREHIEENDSKCRQLEATVKIYMERITCNVDSAIIVADTEGFVLFVQHKSKGQLSNVRRIVLNMLRKLPKEQLELIRTTFRPMDQIDMERVQR